MDRILEQNDTLFKLFEYSTARWHGHPMASYIDGTQAYTYGSFQEKVLKFFGIGGAKLSPEVEAFLHRIHFPYAIGYGLTETAPLVCNACVGRTRVGSIGVPAYGVEVRLDNVDPATGEGEIVARGRNVMLGYYKDPSRTAKAIRRTDGSIPETLRQWTPGVGSTSAEGSTTSSWVLPERTFTPKK